MAAEGRSAVRLDVSLELSSVPTSLSCTRVTVTIAEPSWKNEQYETYLSMD